MVVLLEAELTKAAVQGKQLLLHRTSIIVFTCSSPGKTSHTTYGFSPERPGRQVLTIFLGRLLSSALCFMQDT